MISTKSGRTVRNAKRFVAAEVRGGILKLSCNDLSFRSVLENLIRALAVPSTGLMNECAKGFESAYRRII